MDLSVIIPCYNSARWVGETVESVLHQTLPPTEIIVVNDGSTDDSAAVLRRFGDRIRVVDQANRGLGGARNSGVRVASSSWLAFLDADDYYDPTFIASMQELHTAFPDAQLLFTDHSEFGEGMITQPSSFERDVPELRELADRVEGKLLAGGLALAKVVIQRNGAFAPSSLVVRHGLFERVGRFNEGMCGTEDLDFYIHAAPQTTIGVVDRPLLHKRHHATSLGRNYNLMRPGVDQFYIRAEAFYRLHYPELLPLLRQKYRGLLRSWGSTEYRLGMYPAARKTFWQLVQAEPFRLAHWSGFLTSSIRCLGHERASPAATPSRGIEPIGATAAQERTHVFH
jgi:glycosyltransferase involved in cell wall biosynthesis